MYLNAQNANASGGSQSLALRCPICRQNGSFDTIAQDLQLPTPGGTFFVGHRRCPNRSCGAYVFVIYDGHGVRESFPPLTIDFDTTNIPQTIVSAFTEAITCHATQCFIAAAIMVRKTLEELCRERQATGANLKARIRALANKVVLPQELLDGLDDLRLLGNDAAHIESQEFDKVGKEEVEVGIEFTKEVLKAVYQYSALLARLRSLKKAP